MRSRSSILDMEVKCSVRRSVFVCMKPQNECEFKMPDIPLLSQLNSKPETSLKTQRDQRLSELKKNTHTRVSPTRGSNSVNESKGLKKEIGFFRGWGWGGSYKGPNKTSTAPDLSAPSLRSIFDATACELWMMLIENTTVFNNSTGAPLQSTRSG